MHQIGWHSHVYPCSLDQEEETVLHHDSDLDELLEEAHIRLGIHHVSMHSTSGYSVLL